MSMCLDGCLVLLNLAFAATTSYAANTFLPRIQTRRSHWNSPGGPLSVFHRPSPTVVHVVLHRHIFTTPPLSPEQDWGGFSLGDLVPSEWPGMRASTHRPTEPELMKRQGDCGSISTVPRITQTNCTAHPDCIASNNLDVPCGGLDRTSYLARHL